MEEKIVITKSEYLGLRKKAEKLDCLECGGVDNWEGYGESLHPNEDDGESINTIYERIEKEVAAMPTV